MNTDDCQYQRPDLRLPLLFVNILILFSAVLFFLWLDSKAVRLRAAPAVAAGGPIVQMTERQQDVLRIYEKEGLWGARVIHLNRYFNMQNFSPKDLFVTTRFPVRVPDLKTAYQNGVDSHTWLFIATRLGMVRTVTTVLPDQVFAERAQKAKGDRIFTFADGAIRGYTYDIPRTITTLDSLSGIEEPVVANVDAGYFSGGADPVLTAARLKEKCRDMRMLVLIDSTDEPEVTDGMREKLRAFETAWRTGR